MDLALEFGVSVAVLKRTMSERELVLWARYANEQRLPARRMEFYMAQVAHLIAVTMGGSKSKLTDFLIDFVPEAPVAPLPALIGADVISAMSGGTNVRVLGARRRERERETKGTD